MKCPLHSTSSRFWEQIIPNRKDILLEDIEVFDKFIILNERQKGLTQFRVLNLEKSSEYLIDMEEESYTAYISTNFEFGTSIFRFGFSSLKTPTTIYDFNLDSKDKEIKKQTKVIGGHNPSEYSTKRTFAKSNDGTLIPMSLVYKNNIQLNGNNPTLLYGYGSYGHVIDPSFSPARLSLLDRGFIFAIAHIRGGEDLGRHWYEDGKMLQKINTFDDFIACGEFLIDQNYTSHKHLFAMGGSAGGLLIGAVINMKPQLGKPQLLQYHLLM